MKIPYFANAAFEQFNNYKFQDSGLKVAEHKNNQSKMHHFLYLTIIVTVAAVAYANISSEAHAEILRYENNIDAEGNYKYAYETSNGIRAQEKGIAGEYVSGGYAYSSPEGELFQLTYLADENGFQPSGSHLPIAPPIPYAILKSLDYIRNHPYYNKS